MKVLNIILALIFALFAIVQIDDPDPEFWILFYGAMALISAFAAFEKFNLWIILLAIAICAFEIFRLFPAFSTWVSEGMPNITKSMKPETPHVELVREFLGLFISLFVLGFHYFRCRILKYNKPGA